MPLDSPLPCRKRRILYAVIFGAVILAAVAGGFLWHEKYRYTNGGFQHGHWNGYSADYVRNQLGEPTEAEEGYTRVGLPPANWKPPFWPGPYKTFVYRTRLGTLFIWFVKRDGEWNSIDSLWYDKGMHVD